MSTTTVFESPTALGAKIITISTTITNTSGAYTATISDERLTASMKAIKLELGDPSVFDAVINVAVNNGSLTISCASVTGTSTAVISVLKTCDDPTAITTTEFDVLANRIGDLDDLETTAQTDLVSAVNEVKSYKEGVWNNFTTPASSGITFYNNSTATSGYIIRSGFCFVNVSMSIDAAVGDTSKAVVSGLPASLKNTIKPPSWSSFAANNVHAESLLQSNILYIRNASVPTSGRWNISFVYPVA